jgi:hypothetical protein
MLPGRLLGAVELPPEQSSEARLEATRVLELMQLDMGVLRRPASERFALLLEGLRRHCSGMILQVSTGGRSI